MADPKAPIIFVANLEEAESSRTYLAKANRSEGLALWAIYRPGCVNVNGAEGLALAAMRSLIEAMEGGPLRSKPAATLEMQPGSAAAVHGPTGAGTRANLSLSRAGWIGFPN